MLPAKIRDVLSSANDHRAGAVPLGHLADGVTQRRSAQIGEVLEIAFSLLFGAPKYTSEEMQRLSASQSVSQHVHVHTSLSPSLLHVCVCV